MKLEGGATRQRQRTKGKFISIIVSEYELCALYVESGHRHIHLSKSP